MLVSVSQRSTGRVGGDVEPIEISRRNTTNCSCSNMKKPAREGSGLPSITGVPSVVPRRDKQAD